jgi:glucose/arabinose dehydrogenase
MQGMPRAGIFSLEGKSNPATRTPMIRLFGLTLVAGAAISLTGLQQAPQTGKSANCAPDNAGLQLPAGFCATLFADSLVGPRQMDVAPNGDVFVGLRGRPGSQQNAAIPGGVVALRDANGDGRAERRAKVGEFEATAVKVVGNQLFTENKSAILRYRWNPGQMALTGPDTIVGGLPGDRSHGPKTFAIRDGSIYVNHGSPSNACQERDRAPASKGVDPCPELATRAGIWRYDLNKRGQKITDGERFATGIRNAVAIAFQPRTNQLYVVQHGRDMLSNNWPELFSDAKSAETPAEEIFQVNRGDDFGWPYCYFDPDLGKKVLAPEYGGDGTTVGRCADKKGNVGVFPGHWAPNDLLFYTGNALPAKYRNGAFIVFHGSWNRAPLPQQGFKVVFQPLVNGRASGNHEVFVDGFVNAQGQPTALGGRPMGLAQGPRGELYLSDDSRGRIWKITYTGRQ